MPGQANHYLGEHLHTPDLCEPITAFRTWKLCNHKNKVQLISFSARTAWSPIMKAECNAEAQSAEHGVIPSGVCSCGIYGFFKAEDAHNINQGVLGVCEHWGKTEVHSSGIRSEHARIKAVYCNPKAFSSQFLAFQKRVVLAACLFAAVTYGLVLYAMEVLSLLVPVIAFSLLLMNLLYLVFGFFNSTSKNSPLTKWGKAHNVVVCKSVEELQDYCTHPLSDNLKPA